MKKLILLVISLLPLNIYAKTIYVEDGELVSDEYLVESELLKLDYEERFYNTYELEYLPDTYKELSECINCDLTDKIVKTSLTDEPSDREIYPFDIEYNYFKYIEIVNYEEDFTVYEIEIYSNGEKIDYNCSNSLLNDNDYNTSVVLSKAQKIKCEFANPIMNDFEVRFHIDSPMTVNRLNISYKRENDKFYTLNYNLKGYGMLVYNPNSDLVNTFDLSKMLYLKDTEYYMDYIENKVVLNEYKIDGDNLLLDDFITKYHYKVFKEVEVVEEEEKSIVQEEIVEEINIPLSEEKTIPEEIVIDNVVLDEQLIEEDNNIKYEDIYPTDNIDDEEVLKVVPLKQSFDKTIVNKKDKIIVIVILLFYILLAAFLLIIYIIKTREKN